MAMPMVSSFQGLPIPPRILPDLSLRRASSTLLELEIGLIAGKLLSKWIPRGLGAAIAASGVYFLLA